MKRTNLWLLLCCLIFLAGMLMLATMERIAKRAAVESPPPPPRVVVDEEPPSPAPTPARAAVEAPVADAEFSGHPDALAFGTDAIAPEREVAVLFDFLHAYRREFGAFPTGNENAHFLNALAGANPGQMVIFPIDHPRVSPDGELLDAWGRPFHFHAIDRHHLEVRSAGPDRELFTDDDIIAPPARGR
jgi:hypothetical protein